MKKNIYFSIILCTYNGAQKIEMSIQSLLNQDFPRNKFEIIVVDDGSTDDTSKIASKFPIRLIKNKKNLGLAGARNVGLKKSKREIIICFDDDSIADKNWLKNLSKAFANDWVMGAGGVIELSREPALTDEYCLSIGYGNPVPLMLGSSESILGRFFSYLKNNYSNPQSNYKDLSKVLELPGILSSFRKNLLENVNGWDENLINASEDLDICRRLKLKYPDLDFVVMPSAKVIHKQDLSFWQFISKEYRRGQARKKYYQKKNQTPPYFPFPFVYLVFLVILIILFIQTNLLVIIPFILFLPYFLYSWWIFRGFKEKNVRMFLFPYMQLVHEGATVLGMLR